MRFFFLASALVVSPTTLSDCGGSAGGGSSSGSSSSGSSTGGTATGGTAVGPACTAYDSTEEESAPIQTAAAGLPAGAAALSWTVPVSFTSRIGYAGTPGRAASHEGIDWVHDDASTAEVDVAVAADGDVVYVRTGCPESDTFSRNTDTRECGSGWGNHVVVHHGGGAYSRYAHLADGQVFVEVGDTVAAGDVLAVMGNTGRSEVRHLHFELGTTSATIDPCAAAWSFDAVYDPAGVGL